MFEKALNEKGQAFSTFKLLIAAIVAIAILGILFSILGGIPGIGQADPQEKAASLVKDLKNKTATHKKSGSVVFGPGDGLVAKAIAEAAKVGLTDKQICISQGEFADFGTDQFEGSENGGLSLINITQSQVSATLSVMCDRGADLEDDIDDYYGDAGLSSDWVSDCTCVTDSAYENQTCCAVMLRTTH